jgi:hypothetical protein
MQAAVIDSHELAAWVRSRLLRLMEDGASAHLARGYADYAAGRELTHESVLADPFAAEHYHEGYVLAAYELGITTSTIEEVAACFAPLNN